MEIPLEEKGTEVSIGELENLCKAIHDQRIEYDNKKKAASEELNKLDMLEGKLLLLLENSGKDSYTSNVGKFYVSHKTSVRIPRGPDWDTFLSHIKSLGHDQALLTVNSATLNKWYKEQFDAAVEAGVEMAPIPGLGEPSISQTLCFRKA